MHELTHREQKISEETRRRPNRHPDASATVKPGSGINHDSPPLALIIDLLALEARRSSKTFPCALHNSTPRFKHQDNECIIKPKRSMAVAPSFRGCEQYLQ